MDGGGNHRAGHAQALGDMALHLGAQHQLHLQLGDLRLDVEIVVGDQRLDPIELGGLAHLAGEFAGVSAEPHDLEAQLRLRDARGGDGVAGVAEHEDALAREIGGIHRARVPGQTRGLFRQKRRGVDARERSDFRDEIPRGADADGDHLGEGLAMGLFEILGGAVRDFGIEHHVEIGVAEPCQILRRGAHGRDHIDVDPHPTQQLGDFPDVVAVAEAQGRRSQQIAQGPGAGGALALGASQGAHEAIEGLRRAPVFLFLIGGQFQRHHGNRQGERGGEAARIVLNEFGGAGGADNHGLGLEALIGFLGRALEEFGGVAAQIPGLEGRVGHGRAGAAPLDHGEEQVRIGVALGGVQHIMQAGHAGGHAHGADVGRAFVGPDGELHGQTSSRVRRLSGRANNSARSPACS